MWTLSGFGDEIDPDPHVQIAVLDSGCARPAASWRSGAPIRPHASVEETQRRRG
jgi:hypothetical protein